MDNAGRTILLVEDEVLIALAEERLLAAAGYNVLAAFSGEDAVKIATNSELKIDLVLMDIDLGKGIDGTQAAMDILKYRNIPVLFRSSHTEKDIVEKTEKITSYGYVVKHCGITILDASIKMAFRLHNAYMELKEKEESLLIKERAIESSINAIAILDPECNLIYVNPSFLKLWRYNSSRDVLGLPAEMLWQKSEQNRKAVKKLYSIGGWRGEMTAVRKDHSIFDVEASASIMYGQNQNPIGLIAAFQNITERKMSETQLRENRESYRILVENIESLVCETDSSGVYTYISPAYKKVTGYEPDDLLGKSVVELLHPDDLKRWDERVCSSVKPKHSIRESWRFRIKNGEWRWMDSSITFFEKNPGNIRAVVISTDITDSINEEKRMERLINENEIYLEELGERVINNSIIIKAFIDFMMARFHNASSGEILIQAESSMKLCVNLYEKFQARPVCEGINLYDYIKDIITSISITKVLNYPCFIVYDSFEHIMIDIKWVLPLGLLLNELITSVMRYTYPGNNNGEITINRLDTRDRITICIAEKGIEFKEAEDNSSGLGMELGLIKKFASDIGLEIIIRKDSVTRVLVSFAP